MKNKLQLFVSIGGPALALAGMAMLVHYGSPKQRAWRFCKQAVEERLRAPRTAYFGPFEYEERAGLNREFEIRGSVDAENAFGTPLRQYYLCVALDGDEAEVHFSETRFLDYSERLSSGRGPF